MEASVLRLNVTHEIMPGFFSNLKRFISATFAAQPVCRSTCLSLNLFVAQPVCRSPRAAHHRKRRPVEGMTQILPPIHRQVGGQGQGAAGPDQLAAFGVDLTANHR